MRATIIGLCLGFIATLMYFFFGKYLVQPAMADVLFIISTPVAKLVAFITGRTLEQEEAIYIYAFWAIPITFILLGGLTGFLFSALHRLINSRGED